MVCGNQTEMLLQCVRDSISILIHSIALSIAVPCPAGGLFCEAPAAAQKGSCACPFWEQEAHCF